MKKINKLLMPIAGLSAITAGAIPLASCKKSSTVVDGVQVTKTQWEQAIAYLAACKEGATWKTSSEDVIQILRTNSTGGISEWSEYFNIAFNDNLATVEATGSTRDPSSWVKAQKISSVLRDNFYLSYDETLDLEGKTKLEYYCDLVSLIQQALIDIFTYYTDYSAFSFDKETKTYGYSDYKYDENTGELIFAVSKIRFNSNKKVSYINTHYGDVKPNGVSSSVIDVVLHPVYNNVKVDVDQAVIDIADAHVKNMTANTLTIPKEEVMVQGSSTRTPLVLNVTPKNGGEKTLKITAGNANVGDAGIYLNGELLEETTDYTMLSGVITFTDTGKAKALKKTDKLNIGLNFSSIDASTTEFQFTLA